MPRVTIHIGARERLNPTISKATLLLPTDALVWIGTTSIAGTATAMRALADALIQPRSWPTPTTPIPTASTSGNKPSEPPTADPASGRQLMRAE